MNDELLAICNSFLEAASVAEKWRMMNPLVRRLEIQIATVMKRQLVFFLRGFALLPGQVNEANAGLREGITEDDWVAVWERVSAATTEDMFDQLQAAERLALGRGAAAVIADVEINIAFTLRHPLAEQYLMDHGYGLISQIDATTRGNLATIINAGIRAGWSYNRIANEIINLYSAMSGERPQAHIDSRAHLIAVTEIGNAYEAGSAIIVRDLQDAGLQMEKKWLTVGDDRVSTGCRANQAEGWIPFAQSFSSGHQHPLRFPGCRCTTLYQRSKTRAAAVTTPITIPLNRLGTIADIVQPQDDAARQLLDLATDTMNRVHRVPSDLPSVPFSIGDTNGANGFYTTDWTGVGPSRIVVNVALLRKEFTLIHEFGHYLDHQHLAVSDDLGRIARENIGRPVTGISQELQNRFWTAINNTRTVTEMEQRRNTLATSRPLLAHGGEKTPEERLLDYHLQQSELWARAYAQWVATRAGRMQQDISGRSAQWESDEFIPIANIMDEIFKSMGLLP